MRKRSYGFIKQHGCMVIVTNGRDKDGDIEKVTMKKSKQSQQKRGVVMPHGT